MLVLLTIKRLVEGGMGWKEKGGRWGEGRERERREGEGEKGGEETLAQHTYM